MHQTRYFLERDKNLLKSALFVKVRFDDILVSDKNNEEHLKTLQSVSKIIFKNELKFKLQKFVIMQPEVIFLGYRVNKDHIFPLHEKVDFIKNAESQKL